jgi:CheY-like chemotaxis protein
MAAPASLNPTNRDTIVAARWPRVERGMRRVVVGEFGEVFRRGLRDVFAGGAELVAEETPAENVLALLLRTQPDVVVLDLDRDGVEDLVSRIATQYPAVKVIACSSTRPSMRVFPPFHHGQSYEDRLDPAILSAAIRSPG